MRVIYFGLYLISFAYVVLICGGGGRYIQGVKIRMIFPLGLLNHPQSEAIHPRHSMNNPPAVRHICSDPVRSPYYIWSSEWLEAALLELTFFFINIHKYFGTFICFCSVFNNMFFRTIIINPLSWKISVELESYDLCEEKCKIQISCLKKKYTPLTLCILFKLGTGNLELET